MRSLAGALTAINEGSDSEVACIRKWQEEEQQELASLVGESVKGVSVAELAQKVERVKVLRGSGEWEERVEQAERQRAMFLAGAEQWWDLWWNCGWQVAMDSEELDASKVGGELGDMVEFMGGEDAVSALVSWFDVKVGDLAL